jgi:hypothetical protein
VRVYVCVYVCVCVQGFKQPSVLVKPHKSQALTSSHSLALPEPPKRITRILSASSSDSSGGSSSTVKPVAVRPASRHKSVPVAPGTSIGAVVEVVMAALQPKH